MFGAIHSRTPLPPDDLATLARGFAPRVESLGPQAALLDLRGMGRVWKSPEALAAALRGEASGRRWEVRVALAATRVAALIASRAAEGPLVIPAGGEAAHLAPLPLDLLDLSEDRRDLLRRWGLATLGDLAALPVKGLSERLGPEGPRLWRLARGEDDTPLVATPRPESFACTLELEWPVDGLEPLSFVLARVLEPLAASLVERGRRAAALEMDLALVDGSRHRRALRPAAPSAEPRTWRTLLLLDLESHPPRDAIAAVTVRAEPTAARHVQFSLLDPALPSPERLAELMARLVDWTGDGRGGSPALLDTHRPGAFVMETFCPRPGHGDGAAPLPPPRLALRAYRPPLPAEVAVRNGVPTSVSAAGMRGPVVDCAGPWRASGDWWDVAWSREEWDVALAGGGLFRIYRDRLREGWYVEGEVD